MIVSSAGSSVGRPKRRSTSSCARRWRLRSAAALSGNKSLAACLRSGADAKQNLKACSRVGHTGCADILDRCDNGATYSWRVDASGVIVDGMAEWEGLYQRRSEAPLPNYGLARMGCREQLACASSPSPLARLRQSCPSPAVRKSRKPSFTSSAYFA